MGSETLVVLEAKRRYVAGGASMHPVEEVAEESQISFRTVRPGERDASGTVQGSPRLNDRMSEFARQPKYTSTYPRNPESNST